MIDTFGSVIVIITGKTLLVLCVREKERRDGGSRRVLRDRMHKTAAAAVGGLTDPMYNNGAAADDVLRRAKISFFAATRFVRRGKLVSSCHQNDPAAHEETYAKRDDEGKGPFIVGGEMGLVFVESG